MMEANDEILFSNSNGTIDIKLFSGSKLIEHHTFNGTKKTSIFFEKDRVLKTIGIYNSGSLEIRKRKNGFLIAVLENEKFVSPEKSWQYSDNKILKIPVKGEFLKKLSLFRYK